MTAALEWVAINAVTVTEFGRYEIFASMDMDLWDADFTDRASHRISPVAEAVGSFVEARQACERHHEAFLAQRKAG